MKMKLGLLFVAIFGQILGCSYDAAPHGFEMELGHVDSVIYGDSSIEELPGDQPYRKSLVSLFDRDAVKALKKGDFYQVEEKFGGSEDLPWSKQASSSYCSGVLIGADLVLTAGHCLADPYSCDNLQLLFNYESSEKSDAYEIRDCQEVVRSTIDVEGRGLDYAVIRLNKAVVSDLPEYSHHKISIGSSIYALGDPLGSFKKKASGKVRSHNKKNGAYVTTLDVFEGNSGSPVFSSHDNKLVGILLGGEKDFIEDGKVNHCPDDGCLGEIVIPIQNILNDLKN